MIRCSVANLGLGHGAIDTGGGYTYFNPATGNEFSGVAGLTYNFKNPDTQYQSGIDFHFDWGASHFLSKQVLRRRRRICLSADYRRQWARTRFWADSSRAFSESVRRSDTFSRSADMQGFLGLRAYGEFDAANRPSGWNTWLTFSISQAAPAAGDANPASDNEIGVNRTREAAGLVHPGRVMRKRHPAAAISRR